MLKSRAAAAPAQDGWAGARVGAGACLCLLAASLFAAVLAGLWMPVFLGFYALPIAMPPAAWHLHELLFGLIPALLAGIVLAAAGRPAGNPPLAPFLLVLLLGLWLAGRIAFALSAKVGLAPALAVDLAFPLLALVLLVWQVRAEWRWKGHGLLAAGLVLLAAQMLFNWEIWRFGRAINGHHIAIAALLVLFVIQDRVVDRPIVPGRPAPISGGAYLFLALGLALGGLDSVFPFSGLGEATLKAFIAGSILLFLLAGVLGLALGGARMSRGLARLSWLTGGLLVISALAEIARALAPQFTLVLLPLAGLCWMLAFIGLAGTLARALAKGEPARPKAP